MSMKKQRESSKKTTRSQTKSHSKKIAKPKEKAMTAKSSAKRSPSDLQIALSLRNAVRRSRPEFLRQESWRYKRVGKAWRKPRGIDSKMRHERQGWPSLVKVGYRGPRRVRGLHPTGFRDILIHDARELSELDPKKDAVRLSSSLGRRKRGELVTRAREIGLKILNPTRLRPRIPKT